MKKFFSGEGGFFGFMDKIASLFWINLLTTLCCIPVITAGASFTACYYVTLKMVRNEEGYLTKSFFKSFRMNFRQSTVIWIFEAILIFIFAADFRIITTRAAGPIPLSNVILVVTGILLFLLLMTAVYVYPILARFDNTTVNTVKNAFLMGIANFPKTVALIVTNALFPALIFAVVMTGRGLWVIPVILCFGISASAYLCSRILVGVFDTYMPAEEEQPDDAGDTNKSDTEEIREE
ncbi:MAG: YesL family protein [Lachnospiraceae bacterium]|nr:YesL family protein [Lachnospiraceae bacterium]